MESRPFTALPPAGAWQLLGAYEGFEVARFTGADVGMVLEGTTVGQEAGVPWSIHYAIDVGDDWQVKRATVSDDAGNELEIVVDGKGLWTINGQRRSDLEGCLDLDLEASVVTNTVPIHRLALSVGQHGESGAVYLRTIGLEVERLDQTYRRLPDADGELRFEYQSPRFGYHDTLRFGTDGLVIEYPGIGVRR